MFGRKSTTKKQPQNLHPTFSREFDQKAVEGILWDEAEMNHCSPSSIMGDHLLNSMLPKHPEAAYLVGKMYYGDKGIGNALNNCFGYLAGGIDWKALHDNAKPLVEFASRYGSTGALEPGAHELHHLHSQLESISRILSNAAKEDPAYVVEAEKSAKFYQQTEDHPDLVAYHSLYRLVLDNWKLLGNSTFSFRMLTDLASMQKDWPDSAEVRLELVHLLDDVSSEWTD